MIYTSCVCLNAHTPLYNLCESFMHTHAFYSLCALSYTHTPYTACVCTFHTHTRLLQLVCTFTYTHVLYSLCALSHTHTPYTACVCTFHAHTHDFTACVCTSAYTHDSSDDYRNTEVCKSIMARLNQCLNFLLHMWIYIIRQL